MDTRKASAQCGLKTAAGLHSRDFAMRFFKSFWGDKGWYVVFFTTVFLFLVFMQILRHEMWLDEVQPWFLARDSVSIPALLENLRYVGHPALWYLCLFFLSRLIPHPIVMQLFHLGLATAAVYVFLRHSPFTKPEKLLFIFGYFPFYEYAVISRNYALGVLLLFLFCAGYGKPSGRNYAMLSLILFLLTQTSVYGLIIAISLGCMMVFEFFFQDSLREALSKRKKEIAASIVILSLGSALSVIQLIKPADCWFARPVITSFYPARYRTALCSVWRGFVPIPKFGPFFWNTNLLDDVYYTLPQFFLSIIILSFSVLLFMRKAVPLFLYSFGAAGLLAFGYVKYLGYMRHHGQIFILFIACLWLASYYPAKRLKSSRLSGLAEVVDKYGKVFLLLVLAAHLVAGLYAGVMDFFNPFSESKNAADYIFRRGMDGMFIVGYDRPSTTSISAYLGRRMYYTEENGFGSFILWNYTPVSCTGMFTRVWSLSQQQKQDILLVVGKNKKEDCMINVSHPYRPIKAFENSILWDEQFYFYRVSYNKMLYSPQNTSENALLQSGQSARIPGPKPL